MILASKQECFSLLKMLLFQILALSFSALSSLNIIGWGKILCFYMSWKLFKSGNTVNTKCLNQIPNSEPTLREMCPYLEFFWYVFSRIRSEYAFCSNAGKYGPKKLRIRTLFEQFQISNLSECSRISLHVLTVRSHALSKFLLKMIFSKN